MAAKVFEVQVFTNPTVVTHIRTGGPPLDELLVVTEGGDIRWTDDPNEIISTSVGTLLSDGNSLEYRGDMGAFRFIAASGTPTVRIHKYQRNLGW